MSESNKTQTWACLMAFAKGAESYKLCGTRPVTFYRYRAITTTNLCLIGNWQAMLVVIALVDPQSNCHF